MVWHVPTLLVGEFDAVYGQRICLASQYFAFQHHLGAISSRCQVVGYTLLDVAAATSSNGIVAATGVLIGKHVATGRINDALDDSLKSIAVRALATSDTDVDCILWADPNVGGGVASMSFHLGDILARGEKRKFFLAFTHPNHDVLLLRWPLVVAVLRVISEKWISAAERLVRAEYECNSNLLAKRSEAGRSGLRPLLTIVAPPGGCQRDALMALHCMLETAMPRLFGNGRQLLALSSTTVCGNGAEVLPPGDGGERITAHLRALMDREEVACSSTTQCLEDPSMRWVLMDAAGTSRDTSLSTQRLMVRPLAVWLRTMLASETGHVFNTKAAKILRALFSGNQLIISSQDELLSGDFALSLAQLLPPSLRSVVARSDVYRESYKCRIVAFSDAFMETTEIVDHAHLSSKEQLVLSELNATGAIHVHIFYDDENTICFHVDDCDSVIAAALSDELSGCGDGEASAGGAPQGSRYVSESTVPTLVTRVLNMVAESSRRRPEEFRYTKFDMWCDEVTLLQSQLELCVTEYMGRGRLYYAMFSKQEVDNNRAVLGLAAKDGSSKKRGATSAKDGSGGGGAAGNSSSSPGRMRRWISNFLQSRSRNSAGTSGLQHSPHLAGATTTTSFGGGEAYGHAGKSFSGMAGGGGDIGPPYYYQHQRISSTLSVAKSSRLDNEATTARRPTTTTMDGFDLCESVPADHDVLMFLGTCKQSR